MTSMIGFNPSTAGMNATGSQSVMRPSSTGKTSMQKAGGYRFFERPQFTPEQMQLFKSLFSQVGPDSFLSRLAGGSPEMFEQLEAPALRQFSGLQGNIASRFSGMGLGGRHSSGFKNTMNQAASDFAQDLQSQRLGLQRRAIMDLLGMSSELLGQRPFEQFATPKQPSFLQNLGISTGRALSEMGSSRLLGLLSK